MDIGSTIKGSVGAARSFLVFRFFLEGAASEASGCFLFLASASVVLVFFSSEAVDPTAAEDIGHHDNVEDDVVLPQIEHNLVSSLVLTHSKLISIGHPLTPIAQDASWADHPQQQVTPPRQEEEDDFEAQPTPSLEASPALRRLCKGPRSQVPPSSIP